MHDYDMPGWPQTPPIEDQLRQLRGSLEQLQLKMTVDPDGELGRVFTILELKRGSRR